jgi:hypothetical protein
MIVKILQFSYVICIGIAQSEIKFDMFLQFCDTQILQSTGYGQFLHATFFA